MIKDKIKDIRKIKEKLLSMHTRWNAEADEYRAKIEDANNRINILSSIAEEAEDPEEYRKAIRDTESLKEDIEFYRLRERNIKRVLPEREGTEYISFIRSKCAEYVTERKGEVEEEFKKIRDMIESYNADIREVNNTLMMIQDLSEGRAAHKVKINDFEDSYQAAVSYPFSIEGFCKYYKTEKLKEGAMKSSGIIK